MNIVKENEDYYMYLHLCGNVGNSSKYVFIKESPNLAFSCDLTLHIHITYVYTCT